MSFVTVGGEASSRPTFFELVAADRLLPSLKAAITYSLSVRRMGCETARLCSAPRSDGLAS